MSSATLTKRTGLHVDAGSKVLRSVLRVVRAEKIIRHRQLRSESGCWAARVSGSCVAHSSSWSIFGIEFRLAVLVALSPFTVPIFRRILRGSTDIPRRCRGLERGRQRVPGCPRLPSNTVMTIYNGVDGDAIRSKNESAPESCSLKSRCTAAPHHRGRSSRTPQKAHVKHLVAALHSSRPNSGGSLHHPWRRVSTEMPSSLATELGLGSVAPKHGEPLVVHGAGLDVSALSSHS